MVYGVASWRGPRFDFTDGLCHDCAALARSELGLDQVPMSASPRRATAIIAAVFFLLAPEVLDQFPTYVLPIPAAVRPATLVPSVLGVRTAAADEPPAPVPDVASVLAMVTAAASALDGPVAVPLARPSSYRPARLLPPMRSEVRFYDDPTSPLAAHNIQTP
jgi:hypothetical protein